MIRTTGRLGVFVALTTLVLALGTAANAEAAAVPTVGVTVANGIQSNTPAWLEVYVNGNLKYSGMVLYHRGHSFRVKSGSDVRVVTVWCGQKKVHRMNVTYNGTGISPRLNANGRIFYVWTKQ